MAFKDSIKELRLKHNLSKVEMAKKLDVSEGTIRMWENGSNEPRMGAIEKVAKIFNVSKGYLIGLEEVPLPFIDDYAVDVDYLGKVSAGQFEDPTIEKDTLKVPRGAFKGPQPDECIALQVNGDSMNKVLANGSYIVVHDYRRTHNTCLNNNDIIVARIGNQYTIKRVRKTETKIHFDPDSYIDEFKTNTYDIDCIDQIEVLGKVIFNYQVFD
jgi:repressor LexA